MNQQSILSRRTKKEDPGKKFLKRLINVGIVTLITALIWVSMDGYQELSKKKTSQEVAPLVKPLDPQLETEIIEEIEDREEYSLEEIDDYFNFPTATPAFEELEEISQAATPSGSSTNSGDLE